MSRADLVKEFGKAFLQRGYFARFVGFVGNQCQRRSAKEFAYKRADNVKQLYFHAYRNACNQYVKEISVAESGGCCLRTSYWIKGRESAQEHTRAPTEAYAELLDHHAQDHFAHMPKALADDMLRHFRDRNALFHSKTRATCAYSSRSARERVSVSITTYMMALADLMKSLMLATPIPPRPSLNSSGQPAGGHG